MFFIIPFSILLFFRTFAPAYKARALSSAGLEHLPYKQRVGGSNPSAPTRVTEDESFLTLCFCVNMYQ